MEESNNSTTMLDFDSPKEQSSYIKVIGVGGGGGNAVNNMYEKGIKGVDFVICNTDSKALNSSPVPYKIALGHLGAGNKPEVAKAAAVAHKDEIKAALENGTEMLFVTAGMGGGTGTGAAPVIAEIAKEVKLNDPDVPNILVVAVVTSPFSFEGKKRRDQASEGIKELRKYVDSILVVNNDKLRKLGNLPMNEAFKCADDVLLTAVKGIAEIITSNAYVTIDFHDVNTVMSQSGTALMGTGVGKGENRAVEAIEQAATSVLLNDNDISGAKNVLLYFTYPENKQITMDEIGVITDYVTEHTRCGNQEADVIWGAGVDETLNDELKITLIATGFNKNVDGEPPVVTVHALDEGHAANKQRSTLQYANAEALASVEGIHIEHREPAPVQDVKPESQPECAQPVCSVRRFDLNGNEIKANSVSPCQTEVEEESSSANVSDSVDGIRLVHVEVPAAPASEATKARPTAQAAPTSPAPAVAAVQPSMPVSAPMQRPAPPTTEMDAVSARADRLQRARRLNALLHNNPDGPRIVEEMTTEELTNEPIFAAPHSSESDVAKTVMNAEGKILSQNNFLYNQPD